MRCFVAVKIFYERENHFLHYGIHSSCVNIVENRPFELFSLYFSSGDFDFLREDAVVWQAEHGAFFGAGVIRNVKVMDKHKVGNLLDYVERIGNAACGKSIPKAVDFVFKFTGNHFSFSQFHT